MTTINNSHVLETLSLLRRSGILGFEKLPLQPPSSLEIETEKANFYLFRLSLIGENRTRGVIDSEDLKALNLALLEKRKRAVSEKELLNLAGEFQRKFGISYPFHLSNGKIWDPKKNSTPSPKETQNLTQALQNNSMGPNSQVITVLQVPDYQRTPQSIDKIQILLTFLQNSGLAQKDGEMITWIKPEEVISIQADFHHHRSLSEGFKPDGKTVIYRIVYQLKEEGFSRFMEVEIKRPSEYSHDPNANGYLRVLAKKTEEQIVPKLRLSPP